MNKIDAKCKRLCMETSRHKYYTKMNETLIDYNDHNNSPLSNGNIWYAIYKVIEEEESDACNMNSDAHNITVDAHNVTADNFSQTSNTQRENENAILTSEKLDKSDALAATLKELANNDAAYY